MTYDYDNFDMELERPKWDVLIYYDFMKLPVMVLHDLMVISTEIDLICLELSDFFH